MDLVTRTAQISTASQVVLGCISLIGFVKVSEASGFLVTLLVLDLIVQFVEFVYYAVFLYLNRLPTWYRYIDWYISTPIMLITTVGLLEYLRNPSITTEIFWLLYGGDVGFIVGWNAVMLSFGLCHELGYLKKEIAIPLGFLPFLAVFALMYARFAHGVPSNIVLIGFVFLVWALYGLAAWFSYIPKNIAYNCLDVVSKNFYGVLVSIILLT